MAYINIFRGVPALVSVIWVYFGWSLVLGISFTVFQAAVIALVALYGAFIAEIYRAALEAIPRGQREAGLALGMTPLRVFVKITLPQATKIAVPNIGSMLIGMVKDTSVFTVIGLVEVVRTTQNINSITFQPFVLYTGGRIPLRDRRLRDRLRLPGDREVDVDAADGADRTDDPRPPTPARGADRPRFPGCGGDGVTNAPEDVLPRTARVAHVSHGPMARPHGLTATTQGG